MSRRVAGLLAHVRPVFMLPVVATSVCGAALAPSVSAGIAAQHAGAVGTALFVAHLRDGFVDGHVRGEETPPLSVPAYRWATAAAVAVALALASSLAATAGVLAAASVLALLCLALLHAPYLDRHPVPVTVDYALGIAVTLCGGFAAQAGGLTWGVLAVAAGVAALLSGIKVGLDRLDADFDASVGKRTVPVVASEGGATWVAVGCFAAAALVVVGAIAGRVLPRLAALALLPVAGCAVVTPAVAPRWAVRVQMALSYAFVGVLFVALCGGDCRGWRLVGRLASTVGQVQLYLVGRGPELVEHFPLTALL
ncbi:UbiA prenyltransferase family protein [Haloarcula brevis]|uniref:ubiquinone biosynthesis protein UbiA n=1 Tax=Haloarcula brevis TaxID=3111453 RepID=UPI00300F4BAC